MLSSQRQSRLHEPGPVCSGQGWGLLVDLGGVPISIEHRDVDPQRMGDGVGVNDFVIRTRGLLSGQRYNCERRDAGED